MRRETAVDEYGRPDERRRLLEWYDAHRRPLPWREDADPYRVWLSETMLQQTQVATAQPHFERFLVRFPDVATLAEASEEEVLAAWSGLGYYRRARHLHAAAREVDRRGSFPKTAEEWRELPGVGEYTAAAVASIAFGEAVPVVDGNVERVVCRLLAHEGDPRRAAGRRVVREAAGGLVDPRRPGDSNQALMELGATVCRPRSPRCLLCPLSAGCRARREGRTEAIPPPRKRRAVERIRRRVAVVEDRGRVLLFRRPDDDDVLPGMWELPAQDGKSSHGEAERRLGDRYGGRFALEEESARVSHGITHRAYDVRVHRARWRSAGGVAEGPEATWASADDRRELPLSSLVEKVLAALG